MSWDVLILLMSLTVWSVWRLRRQPVYQGPIWQGRRGSWWNLLQHWWENGREAKRSARETTQRRTGTLPSGETQDSTAVLRLEGMLSTVSFVDRCHPDVSYVSNCWMDSVHLYSWHFWVTKKGSASYFYEMVLIQVSAFVCFCFILHSCCIIVSMVGWTWWDWSLIPWTYLPSVLWHCWLVDRRRKPP